MLTQERLKELLEYDPETGDFWWRVSKGRVHRGEYAGNSARSDRLHIKIDKRNYYAHRLAWLYMTGRWPNHEIDHINRKSDDNRWENLREATGSQNKANIDLLCTNTSGFKGVCDRINKYQSLIGFNGKQIHLGYFSSPEEAARAYDKKAVELFGEYACLNFPKGTHKEE